MVLFRITATWFLILRVDRFRQMLPRTPTIVES
jgi:hypothetical protein